MESDAGESLSSEGSRNWLELPPEVTATILQKVGVVDILNNAQRVCTSWRSICRDPSMWRSIDMHLDSGFDSWFYVDRLARHAVDRSCGQLVEITVAYFPTDEFIHHLAQSSSQLRRLQIIYCHHLSEDALKETVSKFPLLEELIVQSTPLSVGAVEAVGRCCPQLKTFKCNVFGYMPLQAQHDDLADIIAEAMPHLCHLQLLCCKITNTGLKAILKGCSCLETLDIRGCYYVDPKVENVGEVCSARYKNVRFPTETIEPDEFDDYYTHDFFDDHSLDFSGHYDEPSDFDDSFYDEDGVDYDDIFDNEEEESEDEEVGEESEDEEVGEESEDEVGEEVDDEEVGEESEDVEVGEEVEDEEVGKESEDEEVGEEEEDEEVGEEEEGEEEFDEDESDL